MSDPSPSVSSETPRGRGRGRGKSRGGRGKYLRARGRGHAYGRPAEFTKRLLLEDEQPAELDAEDAEEIRQRYAKRTLVSNADRYAEEAPELDSDGEAVLEPEVDLSAFLARQRWDDADDADGDGDGGDEGDEDEIDASLAQVTAPRPSEVRPQKGRVQTIAWDAELEEMRRDKAAADANRDLKERFRAKTGTLRAKPMAPRERRQENGVVEAPPLPTDMAKKDPKSEMQDFLDDLLG